MQHSFKIMNKFAYIINKFQLHRFYYDEFVGDINLTTNNKNHLFCYLSKYNFYDFMINEFNKEKFSVFETLKFINKQKNIDYHFFVKSYLKYYA